MTQSAAIEPMPLGQLGHFYRRHLLDFVMPFWLKHAIDPAGGINTCITDEGTMLSRDKYLWSQLRAIYTFSALYNRIEKRQQFLDIATQIFQFCRQHGRNEQGHFIFRVNHEGKPLEGAISIFVESFALLGLSEYYLASGDEEARRLAIEIFHSVVQRLEVPGSYVIAPYEIPPGLKNHGISMAFSYAFHSLAVAANYAPAAAQALRHAEMVMNDFRRPELKALLEYVNLDSSRADSPVGRTVVPGHAIESMWFQIHQYQHLGRPERIKQCLECIRWHMELGWDRQFGGLNLGLDIQGKEPVYWKFADTKLWWPQTEALYALLLAHSLCGESWCLDWYWKLHQVAFSRYPVPAHGEWTQRLDRQFRPINTVVALPVKDPFHLPRALMMCAQLLQQYE